MLNFVLLNDNGEVWDKNDLAVWEDKTYRQPEFYFNQSFFAKSQKKLLTMQSRSILLKKEGKLVTGYYAIKGGKGFITDNNEFSTANVFVEQMTLWKLVNDNFIAKRHIPSKQLWRDAASLIQSTKLNYPPGVIKWRSYLGNLLDKVPATLKIASIKYGDKDGIIIDAFADELQINQQVFAHLDQFADRIPGTVAITDQAVSVFATLAGELVLASGADKGEKGSNLIVIRNKAREKAYFALDLPFRQWLVGVNEVDNYDEKEIAWKKQLKLILFHLADDLIQATPESAYVGCKKDGRWYTLAAADSKFRNILCSAKVLNLVVKTKDDDVK
jgi:CRISPR system Cascade subunit CasA